MPKEKNIVLMAIAGIVLLETIALLKGINGTFFILSIVAISGLGGYQLKNMVGKINGDK